MHRQKTGTPRSTLQRKSREEARSGKNKWAYQPYMSSYAQRRLSCERLALHSRFLSEPAVHG